MKPWFLLFVLSIGAGGGFALLVALARTPVVHDFLPPGFFYHWLIGHVDLALIIGFLSFLIALWHRVFGYDHRLHESLFAYLGALSVFFSALLGLGSAVHNNYVPTIDHPLFFMGVILFGVGYALATLRFLKGAFGSLSSDDPLKSALSISVLTSALFLLTMFISALRTQVVEESYLYFERLYWLPGHVHQFVNASLLLSSWLFLAKYSEVRVPARFRLLNFLLIPFPLLYLVIQLLVQDSIGAEVKSVTTVGYAVGIGVPTLIYAFYFLFRVPLKDSFYLWGLKLSAVIYVLGAMMGYMIAGSDLRIPAHYHGVIASILLSLMLLTYLFLKELGYVERLPSVVKFQPLLYGSGMLLFTSALFWAGVYGAPRKTFGTGYIESIKVYVFMGMMGLGSVLSVVGGIIFVVFVLYSIIRRNEFRVQEKT